MDVFTIGSLKYRRLVASYGPKLAVALALAGLVVAAAGTVQFANPQTERVTETVHEGAVDTTVTTEAVVTDQTRFYDRGTVLVDESVYLREATPDLTITAGTTIDGEGAASVDQSLVLVFRAEVAGERFWTEKRTVAQDRSTVDGGEATVATTVNVSTVADELRTYQRELGGEGTVTVSLQHVVSYRTTHHEGAFADDAPLTFGRRTYALEDGLGGTHELGTERTYETADPVANVVVSVGGYDLALPKAGLAGLAVATVLFGLAGDVWLRHERGVDVTAVERQLARAQFEEWISEGRLDTTVGTHHVPVTSLVDLVDVAIDSDKRVVYDRRRELHAVIDGDVVYYYGTVSSWAASDSGFEFLSEDEIES